MTVTISDFYTMNLKGNNKARVKFFTCDHTDNCPMYTKGKCICENMIFGLIKCPNAEHHLSVGPTKRAKNFNSWVNNQKEMHKATATNENTREKVTAVYGYVYIPSNHLDVFREGIGDIVNSHFIPVDMFNADFIEKLVKHRPQALMGGTIQSYVDKDIPLILQQIKEEFPNIYKEWESKYPENAEKYADLSPVGRTIYIRSLPDGTTIKNDKGTFTKEGSYLVSDNVYLGLGFMWVFNESDNNAHTEVRVEITDKMTTTVTEDMNIGDNPEFVN